MIFFSSTSVVGQPQYTRDFKNPLNQISAGFKSGDLEGQLNLTAVTYQPAFGERKVKKAFGEEHERFDVVCNVGRSTILHEDGNR